MGRQKQAGFGAGATVVGLLGAGVAFAAIPTDGVISSCYNSQSGKRGSA